ncbi:RrF2 family transcriptional regulator [Tanticharoenia sakaeratensis]|uniref:Transcriptional regulator n=1 Tax=Tanticharoenia sakaeratensis NBRC 103193 TaxID=1231623 RepID=A0A0D6MNN3_9PROT|nr:Rrf2 family transcriptional regulator [Tanticharoenia sakaeratensis]GAN55025.1 transcriptional regulator [Tanticharoenia sakaeratensis NBRC 103193]GBQ19997.1 Rrf2 family transcriptional regulator [Tanticharoenia sakaeratensis NBRC 103193]
MRLTRHTDYALRVLMYLDANDGQLSSIREIALTYRISENFLMKIVHRLGMAGYIITVRGRGGGLRLAHPPHAIRIGDVVRRTEEDMALVGCMQPASEDAGCLLADACRLRGAIGEALCAFLAVLDGYTLADMVTGHERRLLVRSD